MTRSADAAAAAEKRAQVEREREASFFALLQAINMQHCVVFPRVFGMSTLEQRLTMNCLDEITGRYADFSFLLAFSVCYVLRNRAATNVIQRYRFPFYLSLVGYDCGLRSGATCPATSFWNTAPHLDTNLGAMAREVYTPDVFYETPSSSLFPRRDSQLLRPPSYWTWVVDSIVFMTNSLLLQRLIADTFAGSCWHRQVDDKTTLTSLVINNRFFRWRLLDVRNVTEDSVVNYRADMRLFPKLVASRELRWAYRSSRVVLNNSTLPGRVWYSFHFFVMRRLGLDKGTL